MAAKATAETVDHPLLHHNTSDLSGQRYSSTFTGDEFFLRDHRVRTDGQTLKKVLPGVVYLEMARVAMEQASPDRRRSDVLELRNTVWLKPIIVTERKQVSIDLSVNDTDQVDYEIYSVEGELATFHCEGQAVFSPPFAPAKLDLEWLRGQMERGRLEASDIYALFEQMGITYGPAHQGIVAIALGEKQLLAQLRLPAVVEAGWHEYRLHPTLIDSALQASIGLIVGEDRTLTKPRVPFLLESLRVLSVCTTEMFAWVRYSEGTMESEVRKVDIDVLDQRGNVCIEMRGFATRDMESEGGRPMQRAVSPALSTETRIQKQDSSFDHAFYEKIIADIANHEVTVDEAVSLG
jgi:polyketide synthase PksN